MGILRIACVICMLKMKIWCVKLKIPEYFEKTVRKVENVNAKVAAETITPYYYTSMMINFSMDILTLPTVFSEYYDIFNFCMLF